ncbi:hypothetical protein COCMIDRAFT_41711 [Bipolaris oryzae ATCC 44560]|uniref:Xylanolytic transcriptional activator regulatory domain-containing protein n=1 Tax=Bipolaris oryzae ATCC 44560 TaxID=930090 RepID=W6YWE0_COCMI|nr:uncharacterized protein COCMIDRAFT_41711 [Bipolaris oryzae ATCC 44560]EUC39854.1 hypothetical protein COCMIDRAFT_41711 [Bipolaris oryzae ATCC 44560]
MLWTAETGHVRFIPSSTPADRDNSPYDPHQALCRSVDLSAGPYPLGKRKIEMDQLLDDLPSRHHCNQLKDIFLSSFASLFHILHDPTFNQQYEDFERVPESVSPSWLALLYAIIGTSVMALGPSSGLLTDLSRKGLVADQIAELSERYRSAAFKCLQADNYLWQQNIATLQALIILIYSINHSHGQTWTLLGMAYHIALSLGCHIDPSEFGLDVIRCEERRRCWAGIMMLYMIQAMSLGRLGLDPSNASEGVQMPSDLNDSDLIADEYILPITFNRPSQMSYLLLKFRLYEIANEVSSIVRTSLRTASSLISTVDQRILNEQRIHLNILQGYSHQLMLLLHNHALRRSVVDSQQCRLSVSRVAHSARKILHIYTELFTKDEFSPFTWYLRGIGSFHAYHAAVSLIAALAERSWGLTHEEVLPMVKECAERFEALTETSIICNKALPVLRQML